MFPSAAHSVSTRFPHVVADDAVSVTVPALHPSGTPVRLHSEYDSAPCDISHAQFDPPRAGHDVQLVAPAAEYEPAGQMPHVPLTQLLDEGVGEVAAPDEKYPALIFVHEDTSPPVLYVPAGHIVHVTEEALVR